MKKKPGKIIKDEVPNHESDAFLLKVRAVVVRGERFVAVRSYFTIFMRPSECQPFPLNVPIQIAVFDLKGRVA